MGEQTEVIRKERQLGAKMYFVRMLLSHTFEALRVDFKPPCILLRSADLSRILLRSTIIDRELITKSSGCELASALEMVLSENRIRPR